MEIPTEPAAPIAPQAAAKAASKFPWKIVGITCGVVTVIGIIVALIAVIIAMQLRNNQSPTDSSNQGNSSSSSSSSSGGSVPPVTEVKHGWVATYTIYPGSEASTRQHYLLKSEAVSAPTPLTLSGMTGLTTIIQVVAEDMLLVSDCAGEYGGGDCNVYKYNLTTNTKQLVVGAVKGVQVGHLFQNGNLVYTSEPGKYKLSFLKAGVTTTLISKGDNVGRGVSSYDSRGIFATPDDKYFVAVDTIGSYDGPNVYLTLYTDEGVKYAEFCPFGTVNCHSPLMTNEAMYYVKNNGSSKEYHKYTFATKTDVIVAGAYDINPELSPDGKSIAFWKSLEVPPHVNAAIVETTTNIVKTILNKPYSSPKWLGNELLIVNLNKASEGMLPYTYSGLAVIDLDGNVVTNLDTTTLYGANVRVLNY